MKLKTILTIILLTSGLAGCANMDDNNEDRHIRENNSSTESEDPNSVSSNHNKTLNPDQDNMISQLEQLEFTKFELGVKYENDIEYEAEVELEDNGQYKVKLEDEIKGIELRGEEAFDHIYPMIKDLSIKKDSDKASVIKDVLNTFELEHDYSKFELEIKFNDGAEHEYEDKQ